MRRLRLPILRRPLPVFFTPTVVGLLPAECSSWAKFRDKPNPKRASIAALDKTINSQTAGNSRTTESGTRYIAPGTSYDRELGR